MLKSVALLTEGYVIPFLSISGLTGQKKNLRIAKSSMRSSGHIYKNIFIKYIKYIKYKRIFVKCKEKKSQVDEADNQL